MSTDAAAVATLFTAAGGLVAAVATLVGVVLAHKRLSAASAVAADTNTKAAAAQTAAENAVTENAAAVETIREIVANGGYSGPPAPGPAAGAPGPAPGGH